MRYWVSKGLGHGVRVGVVPSGDLAKIVCLGFLFLLIGGLLSRCGG